MTNETFKPGDTVYLVDDGRADCESQNWLVSERNRTIKLGNSFKVISAEVNNNNQWIDIEGFRYAHPSCKFSKTKP